MFQCHILDCVSTSLHTIILESLNWPSILETKKGARIDGFAVLVRSLNDVTLDRSCLDDNTIDNNLIDQSLSQTAIFFFRPLGKGLDG